MAGRTSSRSIDHRRATALGILADPARAFQLLNGENAPSQETISVVLHLAERHLSDELLIARLEGHGPLSRQTWINLLGHDRITIRPVVDLNAIEPVDRYEIPDRLRDAITWRSPVDMFPSGNRAARGCDLDHTIPYDHTRGGPPGQTRIDNLAPISRRAHRAKTARLGKLVRGCHGGLHHRGRLGSAAAGAHAVVGGRWDRDPVRTDRDHRGRTRLTTDAGPPAMMSS